MLIIALEVLYLPLHVAFDYDHSSTVTGLLVFFELIYTCEVSIQIGLTYFSLCSLHARLCLSAVTLPSSVPLT